VHGVGPGPSGRLEHQVVAEVGVAWSDPGQADRQIGFGHMGAVGVGVGVDGDRGDAHGSGRAHDAPGDLPSVGDE
jgi:hypothetical protein